MKNKEEVPGKCGIGEIKSNTVSPFSGGANTSEEDGHRLMSKRVLR